MVALIAVWFRRRGARNAHVPVATVPVTVLKPLCGIEPRLYENLRSFCEQDVPEQQIIFGARHANDPALAIARRLQKEFPDRDILVISDERLHGSNLKVSNLVNMLPYARHDTLVLADSDMRVPRDYLRRVTAPLAQPGVGLVTCIYRGHPVAGLWSRVGALFVNEWFTPSVSVANLFGPTFFAFGSTIAMRRATLEAVGGLEAVADRLADDYWLGRFTRQLGLRIVLSDAEVTSDVIEDNFSDLVAHELRWLRTICTIKPAGYFGCCLSFTVPIALLGCALAGFGAVPQMLLAAAVIGRLLQHAQSARHPMTDLGLVLISDWLSLVLWAVALNTRRVSWRGETLLIDPRDSALLVRSSVP
jgi:ceramide glucosyltransferase